MSKNKLLTEAVADAKTLRETAFNNAKLSLAESFSPKVQSMISTKLNEMEEELDEQNNEKTLEEILNEMESEEEVPENPEDYREQPGYIHEEEIEGDELNIEEEEKDEGGEQVVDITVDELRDIIRDVMLDLEGGEEMETGEEFEPEVEGGLEDETPSMEDDNDDLDEILNELMNSELEEMSTTPIDGSTAAGDGLENLVSQVKSLVSKSPEYAKKIAEFLKGLPTGTGDALRSESQLAEAKKKINRLITEKNSLNLLNSKLLYLNKIFKVTNLNEAQKVKVIMAFDKAQSVKESENTYNILKESLLNVSKPLVENKGRASKPAGNAPTQKILNEDVNFVSRMQKLAGIL